MPANRKVKNPLATVSPLMIDGKMEGYLVRAPLRGQGLQTTLLEIEEDRSFCDFITEQILGKDWSPQSVVEAGSLPPDASRDLLEGLGLLIPSDLIARKVRYRCPALELPRECLPKRFEKENSGDSGAEDWVVNETYRFESRFQKPETKFMTLETDPRDGTRCYDPDGTVLDAGDSAFVSDQPCLWVTDPGTRMNFPYWIDGKDEALFSGLKAGGKAPVLDSTVLSELRTNQILASRSEFGSMKRKWDDLIQAEAERFSRERYALLPPAIRPSHLAALRKYYRALMEEGFVGQGDDGQVSRCLSMKNETVTTLFHREMTNLIGRVTGQPMKPSYVFARRYVDEAELKYHIDREQSAISVSMLLDYEPEPENLSPWPLYIQKSKTDKETICVQQGVGDLVVYTGTEMPHYRHPLFKGHSSTSIFFMYVPESYDGILY